MECNRKRQSSEKGFALATALMACAILFALAMLIIQLSTGDLKVSVKNVGEKKAMLAAETGIHRMMQNFNPQSLADSAQTRVQVDSANDPASVYTIGTPTTPTSGPVFLPMTGYSIGGGQTWGQRRFLVSVDGENTAYNTTATIQAGVGYGPVEISTMYQ